jgi:hypothetical protein
MVLSLYLWMTAKIATDRQRRQERAARRDLQAELEAVRAEAETLRAELCALGASLREIQESAGALVAPPPARSGLNLSLRSQVLRRHRFGEAPGEIASSLGLPRAEVELLVKVNRLVVENL